MYERGFLKRKKDQTFTSFNIGEKLLEDMTLLIIVSYDNNSWLIPKYVQVFGLLPKH